MTTTTTTQWRPRYCWKTKTTEESYYWVREKESVCACVAYTISLNDECLYTQTALSCQHNCGCMRVCLYVQHSSVRGECVCICMLNLLRIGELSRKHGDLRRIRISYLVFILFRWVCGMTLKQYSDSFTNDFPLHIYFIFYFCHFLFIRTNIEKQFL